jgi:hypothetical protein
VTADKSIRDTPPWLAKLSPEAREAVRRNVAQAPPLSDRQRERLRLLFRSKGVVR